MAKQSGILTIEGTMNNMTFYKTPYGMKVKQKSSISKGRIMKDEKFARTRENLREFTQAGKAAKLLRRSVEKLLVRCKDRAVSTRLSSVMLKVAYSDQTNDRGDRTVANGNISLLTNFNFNILAVLESVFKEQYSHSIDRTNGQVSISIPSLIPAEMLAKPEGSTHFRFVAAAVAIDFDEKLYDVVQSESDYFMLDKVAIDPTTLQLALPANSTRPILLLLGIQFGQSVHNKFVPLLNGAFNSLAIIATDQV